MPIIKAENQLNLALEVSEEVREKTLDLNIGYSSENKTWELIVKYNGDLELLKNELDVIIVELSNEYAIIIIEEDKIKRLDNYVEIEFIEKPKRLFAEVNMGKISSCITPVTLPPYNLFGEGVLVAIIDSGIDYSHPDFINDDGTTRILELWDQTIQGLAPDGFYQGALYTREQINEALTLPIPERFSIVPSLDLSGHGTHVAGIAAGNGRASNRLYRGVASKSELLIVKLGSSVGESFPRTTQLMQGIDYVRRRATELKRPLAINISFGNNYGAHTGRSLLEEYINDIANYWKTSIVIGTGNEGASGRHAQGIVKMSSNSKVDIAVSNFEFSTNIQIWKNYFDEFDIIITNPSGTRVGPIPKILGKQQFILGQTEILLYYGEPTPYNSMQEIYIELISTDTYIDYGIWRIELVPRNIVIGNYNMWLPAGSTINQTTRFLIPSEITTLTIPSTVYRAIAVGAYNAYTDSIAAFSGRGYTATGEIKPDLVAPGVDIMSTSPGGGYTMRSGTSMATPFVTGSAALLMEWGIIDGNDPFLYGEKIKAYLIAGARKLRVETVYPNITLGYGALCLRNSLNLR